jgi:Protein of unknown function (DUF2480)
MQNEIINKVSESGLLTLDLENFYPKEVIKGFDIKEFLFMGLILKEKDYRAALQIFEWSNFKDCNVFITCSADAIVPVWAYMLAATYLKPVAKNIFFGDEKRLVETLLVKNLSHIDVNEYLDKRVVIKGCGELQIPESAYVEITNLLLPVAKSIMYGEPCSTVPIYKKTLVKAL